MGLRSGHALYLGRKEAFHVQLMSGAAPINGRALARVRGNRAHEQEHSQHLWPCRWDGALGLDWTHSFVPA